VWSCVYLGTCQAATNDSFVCHCSDGWQGDRCETRVNHCENVSCENGGVCRLLSGVYGCECLGSEYSGTRCETVSSSTRIQQAVSRSFGYVAIVSMCLMGSFFVVMDVLKYVFGIDPVVTKKETNREKPIVGVRFIYVVE
jgi:hypothetical protein